MPVDPTRYPNGVTTAGKGEALGGLILPDPTKAHVFWDDFLKFTAADWTITTTEAGAGDATEAVSTGARGGVLVVTNDAADNDADFFQWVNETFKFTVGKRTWFKMRFKVSDATQSDFVMGLQITDTTPLAVTDGVYFRKDDGDANLDFVVIKNSTATEKLAISTVSDDTYLTVGFYYDGGARGANGSDGKVWYYVNDVLKGYAVTTNLVEDEELTVSFGIQNGEAVAKIMSVDYIFAAEER